MLSWMKGAWCPRGVHMGIQSQDSKCHTMRLVGSSLLTVSSVPLALLLGLTAAESFGVLLLLSSGPCMIDFSIDLPTVPICACMESKKD